MSPARRLASSLLSSLAIATLVAGCATGSSQSAPATAAEAPAEPIAATTPPTPAEPATGAEPVAAATPTYPDCPTDPFCGADCDNWPYRPTDCKTTTYGPAQADVVVKFSNLLMCTGGTYALCAFSGPLRPTGTSPDNKSLPCVLGNDYPRTADCTCEVFTSSPADTSSLPWFVDINAILNLGAWYQAVQECGADGSLCKNYGRCGPDGKLCEHDKSLKTASVCAYIQNQDPNNPEVSLIPGADLISTFSHAMKDDYSMSPTTSCTDIQSPFYAGCMTAPCSYPAGTPMPPPDGTLVHCQCPTYHGPYQIAQTGQSCNAGTGYIWSGSYSPGSGGS